jgi:hypothetical protein
MTKVVYNNCYGGFDLSEEAKELYTKLNGKSVEYDEYCRHDPILIKVIETLGDAASSSCSDLKIKIIKGNKYIIDEYDGMESVLEPNDISWVEVTHGEN